MAHTGHKPLDNGDPFPWMNLNLLDGEQIRLPDDHIGHWTILLAYRGHW